jgi:single-stranded-DNA-specific exonuclease
MVLKEFGGHAQAAGLTVLEKNIPILREKINAFAFEHLPPEALKRHVEVDMELKLSELSEHFLEELELMEPYGVGNPRPVFRSKGLELKSKPRRLYGETYEVVLADGLLNYPAQLNEKQMLACAACGAGARFEAAYSVKTKQWNGMKTLTLAVKNLQPAV